MKYHIALVVPVMTKMKSELVWRATLSNNDERVVGVPATYDKSSARERERERERESR